MAPWRFLTIPGLLALAVLQNAKGPDLTALSDADIKNSVITLERKPCFGDCPGYKLVIYGDGRVTYNGNLAVKIKGVQQGSIEPEAFRALMKEFAKANFLSLPDRYGERKCACSRQCTDMASATTELTVGGTMHKIDHYYGCICAPRELFDLESAIDKAVNAQQWTGDISQSGPNGTTCFATGHK